MEQSGRHQGRPGGALLAPGEAGCGLPLRGAAREPRRPVAIAALALLTIAPGDGLGQQHRGMA
jgi:hypothetical protein